MDLIIDFPKPPCYVESAGFKLVFLPTAGPSQTRSVSFVVSWAGCRGYREARGIAQLPAASRTALPGGWPSFGLFRAEGLCPERLPSSSQLGACPISVHLRETSLYVRNSDTRAEIAQKVYLRFLGFHRKFNIPLPPSGTGWSPLSQQGRRASQWPQSEHRRRG